MRRIYINGISSISPQSEKIFEGSPVNSYAGNILKAIDEDYKSMIKPMMLRRMSTAVKMGLFCSKKALQQAKLEVPDAIYVGTGQGCLQDTEKFMINMLGSGGASLSPTSFIQSTHNTVGGQIALDLKCFGPNFTFTQNSISFESALIDAMLQMELEEKVQNLLVGAVDETSSEFTGFQRLDEQIKKENIQNLDLFNSKTPGTIVSEAAAFFVLGSQPVGSTYAELKNVSILNSVSSSEINSVIKKFLKKNETDISEVDLVILGKNGDSRFDNYYSELQKSLFSNTCQVGFKHMVGDNNSISSYAFWLACKILKEKQVPDIFKLNTLNCESPQRVLIYNQYLGRNHGLILLQKP
jgi:3-oxoacyl-(acyl-carrier-protein) synthase